MGHAHGHHHSFQKVTKLFITIVLNVLITLAQVVGGFLSGSLSLISDSLHNFSDVVSLAVSYVANRVSKKEAASNLNMKSAYLHLLTDMMASVAVLSGG